MSGKRAKYQLSLANCALDVACTGDVSFADSAVKTTPVYDAGRLPDWVSKGIGQGQYRRCSSAA